MDSDGVSLLPLLADGSGSAARTDTEHRKPTRLGIYKNPKRTLETVDEWFFVERAKFIEIKRREPKPSFMLATNSPATSALHDAWKRAKVTGTKHPDIATLSLKKVSEDIIDAFDNLEELPDVGKRFHGTWQSIKNVHYFSADREFEEAFKELLELGVDESLIDYEGREINREWIDLPEKIVIGLLANGVIPGTDKHVFLRVPKLEAISTEGVRGLDENDARRIDHIFKDARDFPDPSEYHIFLDKYPGNLDFRARFDKYAQVYNNLKEILHKVARINLEVSYAIKGLRDSAANPHLDIEMERLPIYEISIPQINEHADVEILIKTLRVYLDVVDMMYDVDREQIGKDPVYAQCFEQLRKVRIVPLIENPALMTDLSTFICEVFAQLRCLKDELIQEFEAKHRENPKVSSKAQEIFTDFTIVDFGAHPHSLLRVWLARSDTALNYGVITSEIARAIALSECDEAKERLAKRYAAPPRIQVLYGVGLPSFRGGLNPTDAAVWVHYPVDVTLQGIRFDMNEITVKEFVKVAKLFALQPYFKNDGSEGKNGKGGHDLRNLYIDNDLVTALETHMTPDDELRLAPKMDEEEQQALKRMMAESMCLYWDNISKLGTLIRYMDEVTPKLRSRLQTKAFTRENPTIDPTLFGGITLKNDQSAPRKLMCAMAKLNAEWPPNEEPLRLSRAIKLNFFLTNCGVPPTLLDLGVFHEMSPDDTALLRKYIPGLGRLIKNDYKHFVPDAAAILLNRSFVLEIERNAENALTALDMPANFWTEAESNFRDVLLGDSIEHNALLIAAIAAYHSKMPTRRAANRDELFIDTLSQMPCNQINRQLAAEGRLELFSARYPEDIKEALRKMDRFTGDQRWIKTIYAGAKMAVARGWVG